MSNENEELIVIKPIMKLPLSEKKIINHQVKATVNNDLNLNQQDTSIGSHMNSLDFSRLIIQLQSVYEFAKDREMADTTSLLLNFEQALGRKTNLNHETLSVELFEGLIQHILGFMKDSQATLEQQSHK